MSRFILNVHSISQAGDEILFFLLLNNIVPIPNNSSSCLFDVVFDAGRVEITEIRLFWIAVIRSEKAFQTKSLDSLISVAV
jgi:hypothetical protein